MMNGQQPFGDEIPQPALPQSIRTMALVAGQLLYFDEVLDVVVARLEAARIGNAPAELHMDNRRMTISNEMAKLWMNAWDVNPALKVVREGQPTLDLMRRIGPRAG